jgi:hypothetical protein
MQKSQWLDVLRRDVTFTRRVLAKNPAFTATAIVTLALGIAASTVIISVVDAVLLKPLGYQGAGDIYRIYTVDTLRSSPSDARSDDSCHRTCRRAELHASTCALRCARTELVTLLAIGFVVTYKSYYRAGN